MRQPRPWSARVRLGVSLAVCGWMLPALAQSDFSFMPKGGKTLLVEWLAAEPTRFAELAATTRSEEDWLSAVAAGRPELGEREQRTLAAYFAVNLPLDAATISADLPAGLPRDGQQLAWEECQYCHSLFTSHLTQDRDVQGWRNLFQSPFHREMKMTPQEREEFARYSAINMPMKAQDVPEDFRF